MNLVDSIEEMQVKPYKTSKFLSSDTRLTMGWTGRLTRLWGGDQMGDWKSLFKYGIDSYD
jgi:hypothetical protein